MRKEECNNCKFATKNKLGFYCKATKEQVYKEKLIACSIKKVNKMERIKDMLVWFARVSCVGIPVVIYRNICPENFAWQLLNWILIWVGISVYIKLGGD